MPTLPPPLPLSQISCPKTTALTLLERYDYFLLDAYGVLVHTSGAMGGAADFLKAILDAGKGFKVVTNDASRLPSTAASFYQGYGLGVEPEQVLTSGQLLKPFFKTTGLVGARCMVLGPEDSFTYVRQAGGEPIEPDADTKMDALILCADAGYPFLKTMDAILSNLCRHFDRGEIPKLIVPNPDVIYPSGESGFGFTSGAAALLLETALAQRYPQMRPTSSRLGKPFGPMFREVQRQCPNQSLLMIGDQLETDIIGARTQGIDAALVDTGVTRWDTMVVSPAHAPNFRLAGLT
ncbi:MAG: HAD hydrolase-like protein [Myxococcales bacterium]|nr:HAD hydrolase-like protein [Myxococcales bacterium]